MNVVEKLLSWWQENPTKALIGCLLLSGIGAGEMYREMGVKFEQSQLATIASCELRERELKSRMVALQASVDSVKVNYFNFVLAKYQEADALLKKVHQLDASISKEIKENNKLQQQN